MTLEALLAYAHLLAVFTAIVFLTSEAALCRAEWLNAAVVERLVKVDRIYGFALAAILLTGLLRTQLGARGDGWAWSQGLLYLKLVLFAAMVLLWLGSRRGLRQWQQALRTSGVLPGPAEIQRQRRSVMRQAHLLPLVALPAVFLARGGA